LTWWVAYPHAYIDAAEKGDAVHYLAGSGLGYEYRWDFDSDGNFDTEWGVDQRDVNYAFDASQAAGAELVLLEAAGRITGKYAFRVGPTDGAVEVSTRRLGDGWRTHADSKTAPAVRFEGGTVFVRPGASTIRVNGRPADGAEIPVSPGSVVQFGEYAKMRVDAVVRSTLAVRNVFGNVGQAQRDVVVQPVPQARAARPAAKADSVMAQRSEAQ
jgi:hypothetical protein